MTVRPDSSACVVNVAFGNWYSLMQRRMLLFSLSRSNPNLPTMTWTDELPPGSKPHAEQPFGFKVAAIDAAVAVGYAQVLWCDVQCQVLELLNPALEWMAKHGVLAVADWFHVNQWAIDSQLEAMGVTRAEAKWIPTIYAKCIGVDVGHPTGKAFLDEWRKYRDAGVFAPLVFQGSPDRTIRGVRHDQTVASVLVHRLGIPRTQGMLKLHPRGFALLTPSMLTPSKIGEHEPCAS